MAKYRRSKRFSPPTTHRPTRSSLAESTRRQTARKNAKGAQSLSMAWDDTYLGVPGTEMRTGLLSERDKKDTYYRAYLSNCWISGCIEAISKRITSGGWTVVETNQGKGNEANRDLLLQFLRFDGQEEDFTQFLRSIATDLLIYGEAYCEIVWAKGKPVQLHKIDCGTMTSHFDRHGNILGYTQELERSIETVDFEPEQIVRWWLPDPRASKRALSPIEKLKDPIYLSQAMVTYAERFFKQGSRPPYWVELGEDSDDDSARRFLKYYRENYTGLTNAHNPPVLYNGAQLHEFGQGSVDMNFDVGLQRQRDQILLGYGTTPAMLGIIETGNIGGGTGESQDKTFRYNTVAPLNLLIMEKLNYRIVVMGFGIDDWRIDTKQADYRDDATVSNVEDTQIRNGTLTINEARSEHGRSALQGGDEGVIVTSREVTPVSRLEQIAEEQAQAAQLSNELQQTQIEKEKQAPVLPPVSKGSVPSPKVQPEREEAKESLEDWLAASVLETQVDVDEIPTDRETLARQISILFSQVEQRGHALLV